MTDSFRKRLRLHIYPDASPHKCDTVEYPEYRNTVPLGPMGLFNYVDLVGPDQAEFFYMGQFHYEETMRSGGFHLERFPHLSRCPERHIVDIEGDWDHKHIEPVLWQCVLMMVTSSRDLPGKNIFTRTANSRLLVSQTRRHQHYPFTPERVRLGFRGSLTHHWVRILLYAYTLKWGLPCDWVHHLFGFGDTSPGSQETRDYEDFMASHGLALCPRGVPDASVRFYEACFYSCVPVIVGNHGVVGDDYYDTSFIQRIHPEAGEQEMRRSLTELLSAPFDELKRRGNAARAYFDDVIRRYYQDPTALLLRFLVRRGLWGG